MASAVNNKISRNAFNLYQLVFITSLTSISSLTSIFGSAIWFWDCFLPMEESGLHEEYLT